MDMTQYESIAQAANEALERIGIEDSSKTDTLAQLIVTGVSQWQEMLLNGDTLTLIKFYSPVIEREEIFLGCVLLNDFLNKTVVDALKTLSAQVAPVIQDLEYSFVLFRSQRFDVVAFSQQFRQTVEKRLADLLLGNENFEQGIHGDANQMLTFYKSNIEPFPAFILPCEQLPRLLKIVANWLRTLVGSNGAKELADAGHIPLEVAERWRINVILSLLAFFFCKNGREMQSFHHFLSEAMVDGRLPATEVKRAFGMTATDEFEKSKFEAAKKNGDGVNFSNLETAITHWVQKVEFALNSGTVDTIAPNLSQKMFPSDSGILANLILSGTQLGTVSFDCNQTSRPTSLACRFCGASTAEIPEKNILGGSKTGGRFNQSVRKTTERFCLRCAIASYLENRRLGMLFDDGGFPIPKLYNIIFHYGCYQDWEIQAIQRQIDFIFSKTEHRTKASELFQGLTEVRREIKAELENQGASDSFDDAETALLAYAEEPVNRVSHEIVTACQRDIQTDVLTLGAGSEKLLVFVLPQLRPGSKDGLDLVQRRFSQSRLAVFTLLAFLQRIARGHGPWYFQSLPRLAPERMQRDHFYIRNRSEPVERNLQRYSRIVDFAQRAVKYRDGHSQLADQIMLADRLLKDPLGVFSDVLRDSPIRGGDDFDMRYKRLSNDWVKGLGIVNLDEYQEVYQNLHEITKGEDSMPKNVDVERLDVFCDHLFRVLDRAGLFPPHLGEAAHAFEKYPRLLVGLLGRYENVEIGFSEWETRTLRGVDKQKRESVYPYFHILRNWLVDSENRTLLETEGNRKDTLNHLKRSLYGRVYTWLYPRRRLTVAYAQEYVGNQAQFEPDTISRDFKTATQSTQQELGEIVSKAVIEDAREFLISKRYLYRKWKSTQESVDWDNNETTLTEEVS